MVQILGFVLFQLNPTQPQLTLTFLCRFLTKRDHYSILGNEHITGDHWHPMNEI